MLVAELSVSCYKGKFLLGANQSSLKESNEWKWKTMNLFAIQGWLALYCSQTNDNAFSGFNKEPIHMPSDSLHNTAPLTARRSVGDAKS